MKSGKLIYICLGTCLPRETQADQQLSRLLTIDFDKHNVLTQWSLQKSLQKLEQDKLHYEEKLARAKIDKDDILQNKEKFAREHFYMQEADEDVFIIVEESSDIKY